MDTIITSQTACHSSLVKASAGPRLNTSKKSGRRVAPARGTGRHLVHGRFLDHNGPIPLTPGVAGSAGTRASWRGGLEGARQRSNDRTLTVGSSGG